MVVTNDPVANVLTRHRAFGLLRVRVEGENNRDSDDKEDDLLKLFVAIWRFASHVVLSLVKVNKWSRNEHEHDDES